MQRKFLSNLVLLLFLNLLVKPFWILGVDRTVQNELGTEAYGTYFALLNFSFLLNILLDLGITNFNNRNIAQNQHLFSKHFPAIFNLKLFLGVLYMVLGLIAGWVLGYSSREWEILVLLLLNQFLVSLVLYLRSNFAGLHLFRLDSVVSVLDRFLLIIICGSLILYRDGALLTIHSFVLAQTVSYLLVAILSLVLLFSRSGKYRRVVNIPFSWLILRQSIPYALLILLMTFYTRTDTVMLERLLPDGDAEAGVYAQSYRLLEALNMIAFLFSTLLLPMYSSLLKKKQDVSDITRTALRLLSVFAVGSALVLSLHHRSVIGWLYREEIDYSSAVFSWLIWNIIPVSGTYIFGTLLTANGSLRLLNQMAVFGVALNVSLNFWLIPEYKALGAVWATLITQGLTFLVQFVAAHRMVKLHTGWRFTGRILLFAGIGTPVLWLMRGQMAPVEAMVAGLAFLVILAGIMGLLPFQKGLQLLRSR